MYWSINDTVCIGFLPYPHSYQMNSFSHPYIHSLRFVNAKRGGIRKEALSLLIFPHISLKAMRLAADGMRTGQINCALR